MTSSGNKDCGIPPEILEKAEALISLCREKKILTIVIMEGTSGEINIHDFGNPRFISDCVGQLISYINYKNMQWMAVKASKTIKEDEKRDVT